MKEKLSKALGTLLILTGVSMIVISAYYPPVIHGEFITTVLLAFSGVIVLYLGFPTSPI
ncbi:MAG: hypothetical protein ABEJ83_02305 [Candidatus Nanohaloarchaea archaeon]